MLDGGEGFPWEICAKAAEAFFDVAVCLDVDKGASVCCVADDFTCYFVADG